MFNERSDTVCTTVFGIEFFFARIWRSNESMITRRACGCGLHVLAPTPVIGRLNWVNSQAHEYSVFRLVIHQKVGLHSYSGLPRNGKSNVYSESGLPFRNWISANQMRPYTPHLDHRWVTHAYTCRKKDFLLEVLKKRTHQYCTQIICTMFTKAFRSQSSRSMVKRWGRKFVVTIYRRALICPLQHIVLVQNRVTEWYCTAGYPLH